MGAKRIVGIVLVLALAVSVTLWWQRTIRNQGVAALWAIEGARRDAINSPDDVYVPREVAAESLVANYHTLEFTQNQRRVGAALDNFLGFVKFIRDNRNRPVRGDNWRVSSAVCRGEVAQYMAHVTVENAAQGAPVDYNAHDGDCFKQRALRTREAIAATEGEVSPLLQRLPTNSDAAKQ